MAYLADDDQRELSKPAARVDQLVSRLRSVNRVIESRRDAETPVRAIFGERQEPYLDVSPVRILADDPVDGQPTCVGRAVPLAHELDDEEASHRADHGLAPSGRGRTSDLVVDVEAGPDDRGVADASVVLERGAPRVVPAPRTAPLG